MGSCHTNQLPFSVIADVIVLNPFLDIIPDEILILMRGYDTKLNTMITSIDSMQRHNNDKIDQLVTINTNLIAFVNETLQFDSGGIISRVVLKHVMFFISIQLKRISLWQRALPGGKRRSNVLVSIDHWIPERVLSTFST